MAGGGTGTWKPAYLRWTGRPLVNCPHVYPSYCPCWVEQNRQAVFPDCWWVDGNRKDLLLIPRLLPIDYPLCGGDLTPPVSQCQAYCQLPYIVLLMVWCVFIIIILHGVWLFCLLWWWVVVIGGAAWTFEPYPFPIVPIIILKEKEKGCFIC